ncbi:hypothetical protein BJX99DRAFT_253158 [Aspergillus californicus]
MAADNRMSTRTTQACLPCKTRKKKCNRGLPSCNYCILKDLECRYAAPRRRDYDTSSVYTVRPSETIDDSTGDLPGGRSVSRKAGNLYRPLFESLDDIYLEVRNIINSTGEFVDDLTARYFKNFHSNLPVISRMRFQSSLTAGSPSPDASVLLLAICLLVYLPSPDMVPRDSHIERDMPVTSRQSLYLATKSLLAQVQGSMTPSIALIQASLLLATYEYASGRPEAALITLSGCARMAYAARIQTVHSNSRNSTNFESRFEIEEAANTWWGIVISERAFMCEIDDLDQPMSTTFPPGDARLPIDRDILDRGHLVSPDSIPSIPLSSMTLTTTTVTAIGGFARAAQASCLLDQVQQGMAIPDLNTKLLLLESLDRTIQSFLAGVLNHNPQASSPYCTALAITVRTLFTLHTHILTIPQTSISANLRPLLDWKKSSLAALDTVTTMVLDMSEWHCSRLPWDGTNDTSPVHIYAVRAALEHVRTRAGIYLFDEDSPYQCPWGGGAEGVLRGYLDGVRRQWGG